MNVYPPCPLCKSSYTYQLDSLLHALSAAMNGMLQRRNQRIQPCCQG